jgi:signal transduction histidine kinase
MAAILTRIRNSIGRMTKLIDNTLDFTHGRLGGGLPVTRADDPHLRPALEHVAAELGASWPDREILADFNIEGPVYSDRARLAQLLSNLLANALAHGEPSIPIHVRGVKESGGFALSVTNAGSPIPADMMGRLFQPFFRGSPSRHRGLGLGLYIASEIARAHGGMLQVSSTDQETCFSFTMPA